jgi:hypothetical protein
MTRLLAAAISYRRRRASFACDRLDVIGSDNTRQPTWLSSIVGIIGLRVNNR